MRKRKNVKKAEADESDGSEVADEPEEFQDSGEDWTPDATPENAGRAPPAGGRKRGARAPVNNTKKKKKASSSESEPEDEDVEEEEDSDDEKNGSDGNKSDSSQQKDVPKYFHSGNFVILKSDIQWEGEKVVSKAGDVNLWKIDGKALLQKYIPMESNGKTLHKCTCVYSGWNVDNRENYYPVTEILDRNPKTDVKEPCVAINLTDLIKVKDKN